MCANGGSFISQLILDFLQNKIQFYLSGKYFVNNKFVKL